MEEPWIIYELRDSWTPWYHVLSYHRLWKEMPRDRVIRRAFVITLSLGITCSVRRQREALRDTVRRAASTVSLNRLADSLASRTDGDRESQRQAVVFFLDNSPIGS